MLLEGGQTIPDGIHFAGVCSRCCLARLGEPEFPRLPLRRESAFEGGDPRLRLTQTSLGIIDPLLQLPTLGPSRRILALLLLTQGAQQQFTLREPILGTCKCVFERGDPRNQFSLFLVQLTLALGDNALLLLKGSKLRPCSHHELGDLGDHLPTLDHQGLQRFKAPQLIAEPGRT